MPYVALITGASSGIGEATARRLAREPDVRLMLVARREQRLRVLADELHAATGTHASILPIDLTEPDAAARVAAAVELDHGALHLLVNNAGASWRGSFAETGWANVERHMKINFEAPVKLIEALLPILRRTAANHQPVDPATDSRSPLVPPGLKAPVSIVNVCSTASRFSRPRAGSYSASKFALAGWSDALHLEERPHGIHVGLVNPGFIATEGFPAAELRRRPIARHIVSTPDHVAEAILEAGPGARPERYAPRYYWVAAALRLLAPPLARRATGSGVFTTSTPSTEADARPGARQ